MKKILIAAALLFSCGITGSLAQTENKDQLKVALTNPGKPYTILFHTMEGSIKLIGYAGKEILIETETPVEKNKKETTTEGGMKRIHGARSYQITANENNNTVTINSDGLSHGVNVVIRAPQDGKFKLGTVNNGTIEVSNISGEFEVDNVNGPIKLSNISGSAVANTINGNVNVTFASLDPKASMAFTTLNGNVDITLPGASRANLKLKSDNGEILSDFDMDVDKTLPKVNSVKEGNMYRLSVEDWVNAKINGGGPSMMLKTTQGNIYIRKTK